MKINIDVLKHMQEDSVDIEAFVDGIDFESFVKNHLIRKAVCMSLINIGELTKSLGLGGLQA